MTRLSDARTEDDWMKIISDMEKKRYHRNEAQKLYNEKKIKDGELFCLDGAKVVIPERPGEEKDAWCCGTFVGGKLIYVLYSAKDRRLSRLKRQAAARLVEIVKTGMVDTRTTTIVPPRYQSLKNPDFVLHGATSDNDNFESSTFKENQQVFDPSEEVVAKPEQQ